MRGVSSFGELSFKLIDFRKNSKKTFVKNIKFLEMKLSSVNRLRALVTSAKKTPAAVQTIQASDLPEQSTVRGEEGATSVLVDVKYSTINYKGNH